MSPPKRTESETRVNTGWVVTHFAIFWIGEVVPYLLHQFVPVPASVTIGGHIAAGYGLCNLALVGVRLILMTSIEVTVLIGALVRSLTDVLRLMQEFLVQVRNLLHAFRTWR